MIVFKSGHWIAKLAASNPACQIARVNQIYLRFGLMVLPFQAVDTSIQSFYVGLGFMVQIIVLCHASYAAQRENKVI